MGSDLPVPEPAEREANLGVAYRQRLTVDVIWTDGDDEDWATWITESILDGRNVIVDVRGGQLHRLCEHVAEEGPDA